MFRAQPRTIVAGTLAAALFACGSDSVTAPPLAGTVTATSDLHFTPASLTRARIQGVADVTFTFQNTNHTVVWDTQPGGAAAENIPSTANASVSRAFTIAGTYTYHCSIHSSMTGTIVVQ